MLNFNDLHEDMRLKFDNSFLRKIVSTYNLTDAQVEQLNHPVHKVIESEHIDGIATFIKNSKRLIVCGDYDADGVCSTAISVMLAKAVGVKTVGFYIPNRFKEGYGVSRNTIQLAFDKGYTDVLIVDNGVKAHDVVSFALSLGLNVAIVDHHIIGEDVPNCLMLHSDYLDEYAQTMSATGLMVLVAETMHLLTPKILAYGAVATIADVMPVWGKNREIIQRGLEAMNTHKILTLDALSKKYSNVQYDAKMTAFQIVPKINSIGRLADMVNMNTMVDYLLLEDEKAINAYASQVHSFNALRKEKGKETKVKALTQVNDDAFQIIHGKNFHEGIMGIVANQIVNTVNKPTAIFKEFETVFKGSARSNTISLQALFEQLDENYFEAFGGHDFAFGLTVKKAYFENFKEDVLKIVDTLPVVETKKQSLYVDFEILPSMIDALKLLEPFGSDFMSPIFAIDHFEIEKIVALNGFGYKVIFKNYWLKDAVIFNTGVDTEDLMNARLLEGTLENHPKFGLSFTIDAFSV